METVKKIYSLLGDETSKYIFENRLLYSLTEDKKFVRNVVCTIDKGREIYEQMRSNTGNIGIFGAGDVGRHLIHVYDDLKFSCFIDNKKAGIMYHGLPVISLKEFMQRCPDGIIIISTKLYYKEIMEQLLEEGIKKENIINLGMEYKKLNHLQYFDLPQLKKRRRMEEIFVDGGGYDGMTSVEFMKWHGNAGGGYAHTYTWEPDLDNIEKCKKALDECGMDYELVPKGLWSNAKKLKLKTDDTASSISKDGDISIEVDSIDNVINRQVTFIKMDIEGAEYQALLGAKNMIAAYKPKLAICVYHKPEDIWELPLLIYEMNSDYKFFLRHYSFADNETVLYAL
ncbi:MAG: FkbM family methyltransferase [Roseburia sp.]|nr:FkbM family methyltransferase [Roseburia sp.]